MSNKNRFNLLSNPSTPTSSSRRKRQKHFTSNKVIVPASASVDSVKIYYRVRLPDTKGAKHIPRHTAQNDLVELLEVKTLTDSLGGTATVSPSRSACTDTEVRVNVSIADLIKRMKDDIREELSSLSASMDSMDARVNVRMDSTDTRVDNHISQSSFVLECAKYASLRNIEDWTLSRIKRIAGLPPNTPHSDTIDLFLRRYEALGIPREYLLSLRNSSARQIAIGHVHMSPDDADLANIMWHSISQMLNEEERRKYRALMEFGRGLTTVRYIGG